jgi:hypothetical protein
MRLGQNMPASSAAPVLITKDRLKIAYGPLWFRGYPTVLDCAELKELYVLSRTSRCGTSCSLMALTWKGHGGELQTFFNPLSLDC